MTSIACPPWAACIENEEVALDECLSGEESVVADWFKGGDGEFELLYLLCILVEMEGEGLVDVELVGIG